MNLRIEKITTVLSGLINVEENFFVHLEQDRRQRIVHATSYKYSLLLINFITLKSLQLFSFIIVQTFYILFDQIVQITLFIKTLPAFFSTYTT